MIGRLEGYTGDGYKERSAYINKQNDLVRKSLVDNKIAKLKRESSLNKKKPTDKVDLTHNQGLSEYNKMVDSNSALGLSNNTKEEKVNNQNNDANINPVFLSNHYKNNNDIK